jgi:hypothetical protein
MKAAIAAPLIMALVLTLTAVASATPVTIKVTFPDGRPAPGVLVQMPQTRPGGSEIQLYIAEKHLTDRAGNAHFNQPAGFVCFKALYETGNVHWQGHACTRKPHSLTIVLDE